MKKFIIMLLSAVVITSFAGCASEPVDSGQADAQRSRAAKAQQELGNEISRQK